MENIFHKISSHLFTQVSIWFNKSQKFIRIHTDEDFSFQQMAKKQILHFFNTDDNVAVKKSQISNFDGQISQLFVYLGILRDLLDIY